jgi:hypothetical protein
LELGLGRSSVYSQQQPLYDLGMKTLRIGSIVIGVLLVISAITGFQQLEWSGGHGFSYRLHTPLSRVITLVLGIIFLTWHIGIKHKTKWGLAITTVIFYLAMCQFIWQGIQFAVSVASTDTFGAVWAIVSQTGIAFILFLLLRKVQRSWNKQLVASKQEPPSVS